MKFFRLILSRLTLYYQKNKLVFLLFCIGGAFTTMGFLYFYGNFIPAVYMRNDTSVSLREYTVHFQSKSYSASEVKALLGEEPLLSGVTLLYDSNPQKRDSLKIQGKMFGENTEPILIGDPDFTGEDTFSVLASDTSPYVVGHRVSLFDREFTVTGLHNGDTELYIIPFSVFQELEIPLTDLIVYSKDRELRSNDRVMKLLTDIFPEEAAAPSEYSENAMDHIAEDSLSSALELALAYGIVMLAFLFLFLHMMEESAGMTAICRIVGASGSAVGVMHFWEIFCLTVGSSLCGILLHKLLYKPLLSKFNIHDAAYFFSDYCIALLLTVTAVLLFSVPFVIKGLRCSPVNAYRGSSR